MPAINFQSQFVTLIEQGKKRQTIRKLRKKGNVKVGDTLYLYTNQRSYNCRKIGEEKCKSVQGISLNYDFCTLDGHKIDSPTLRNIYTADGFKTITEFMDFFDECHGLPFDGVLIKW